VEAEVAVEEVVAVEEMVAVEEVVAVEEMVAVEEVVDVEEVVAVEVGVAVEVALVVVEDQSQSSRNPPSYPPIPVGFWEALTSLQTPRRAKPNPKSANLPAGE
jgi:hypothetical protein